MTASLCTLASISTGAATPPGGGSYFSSGIALSVLYQVTAELKGYANPINDGDKLVDQIIVGLVAPVPEVFSGFRLSEKDAVPYVIQVPFIDQLFQGASPLVAPFSIYYLITETYLLNNFIYQQNQGLADRFTITRKVRPLSAGGASQTISGTLV